MWYVKGVIEKVILEYCDQDEMFDDGVGWYNIYDKIDYHTPSKDPENIKNQIKKMDKWWRYNNYTLSETAIKLFDLKKRVDWKEVRRAIFGR